MTLQLAKISVNGACEKLIYQRMGESDQEFQTRIIDWEIERSRDCACKFDLDLITLPDEGDSE